MLGAHRGGFVLGAFSFSALRLPCRRMIGSLRGTVLEVHAGFCLVEVAGIGHSVRATPGTLSALKVDSEQFIYIHDVVREDSRELFGFLQRNELELFQQLLGVNGVGPKVALTILSAGSSESVRRAIMQGDIAILTSVPGVGKKTAQKIILDLKGQLVEEEGMQTGDAEVVDALVGLGYPLHTARETVKHIPESIVDVSARVREALKYLSK